jgi:simple sugar transport system permease protein
MTANPVYGVLAGIMAGLLCGVLFGLFVFEFNSSGIVVSIALNLGAWGFTTLMMIAIFGKRGSFTHENIISLPRVSIPIVRNIPYIREIFDRHNILVYLALLLSVAFWFIMYKTVFGLRLRGVGINSRAAQTTGTHLNRYRWYAVLITGALSGIAGSVLPLGGTSIFSENMTAGRGYLAVAAILIGQGNPILVTLSSLLFAYTEALSLGLQNIGIPSQLVLTLPYVATLVILGLNGLKKVIIDERRTHKILNDINILKKQL